MQKNVSISVTGYVKDNLLPPTIKQKLEKIQEILSNAGIPVVAGDPHVDIIAERQIVICTLVQEVAHRRRVETTDIWTLLQIHTGLTGVSNLDAQHFSQAVSLLMADCNSPTRH